MGTPEAKSDTLVAGDTTTTNQDAQTTQSTEAKPEVDWEKRYKDTQVGYTKSRQEIATLKAKLAVAQKQPQLTDAQKDELEDLKYKNPDEWFKKMKELEDVSAREYETQLAAATSELSEKEQRVLVLEEFKHSHPGFHIDDDVLTYDVPKRITEKLGKIPFEEFLTEVHEFLTAPKAIANTEVTKTPNLSKVGGNSTVSTVATNDDIRQSYKNEVY